jgi:hypothetical protein
MDKIGAYRVVLASSELWDSESLEKIGEPSAEDLRSARNKAYGAAGLHAAGHLPYLGLLGTIPAGYLQRTALEEAGIDRNKGGEGTFGARHPILSGFIPLAGTVSGLNAAGRITKKLNNRSNSGNDE